MSRFEAYVSLDSVVFNPEPSVLAVLEAAIPYTVVEVITASPDVYFSFIANIGDGSQTPDWLATEPASVQDLIRSYYGQEVSELAVLAQEAQTLHITNPGPVNSFAAQLPTTAGPMVTGMTTGAAVSRTNTTFQQRIVPTIVAGTAARHVRGWLMTCIGVVTAVLLR